MKNRSVQDHGSRTALIGCAQFLHLVALACVLFSSVAQAQNNLHPSIVVLNELALPPIDSDGNSFFDLPTPSHLSGAARGRYAAHFVLAPNTNAYRFVADASGTTGSNTVPLVFQWSYFIGNDVDGQFFSLAGPSSSPYFTNDPPVLSNSITREMVLDVSNGFTTERLWFGVVVLTPQSATDAVIDWINTHYPSPTSRAQRRLLPPLREASAHFAVGETEAAKTALALFLRRVKISRLPLNRHEARVFKTLTPIIINTAAD